MCSNYNNACGCNANNHYHDNQAGCGCNNAVNDYHDDCGRGCGYDRDCGCDNRGVLQCAACGFASTVFRVIRGLDNSLGSCGCGCGNNGCSNRCGNRNNGCNNGCGCN